VVVVGAAALVLSVPRPGSAQIPDEFTNLKVLPEDIEQRDLLNVMRGFSIGLDVRCTYCHVGEEGQPLSTYDFASDEKPEKRKAREMMRMVNHINETVLTALPDRSEPNVSVTCATCHAGRPRPSSLEEEMMWAYEDGGVEALTRRYRELRERYYGLGTLNFGSAPLDNVAQMLGGPPRQDLEAALAVTDLNLEYHPDSGTTLTLRGQALAGLGRTDEAIRSLERALELNPRNRFAERLLQQLRGGG